MTFTHLIANNPYATNSFVFQTETATVIIDPACDASEYMALADCENMLLTLTHGHHDHIGAVKELMARGAKLGMTKEDAEHFGLTPTGFIIDGQLLVSDELIFRAIQTPGHTPGSCCFYDEANKRIFTGDTLFYRECGRCDLPGGDFTLMLDSLKRLHDEIPDDVTVYPGHERFSIMGDEKQYNQYIQQALKGR